MSKDQTHGVLYKCANLFLYAIVTICNKAVLKYTGTGVAQLFFASALTGFIWIALFVKFVRKDPLWPLTKQLNIKYVFRAFLLYSSRCAFIYSLTTIDATISTTIGYLRPIFALLFGIFILSEKITWRIAIALVISISGAALVTGPLVVAKISPLPILAAFAAPLLLSIYDLLVKKQSEKDAWEHQVYWLFLLIVFISFPMAASDWNPVNFKMLTAFILMGLIYVLVEITLAKALKRITLVLVAPISFIRIIFTAIFAYLFLEEKTTANTIIGCSLIIIATIFMLASKPKKAKMVLPDMNEEEA